MTTGATLRSTIAPDWGWTPAYGHSTLADLMPSIGAHLSVPGCDDPPMRLPDADRYVVVLVDGLGWQLVRQAIQHVPYLAGLLGDASPITSAVPSTTATSLACLGTGLPPGQHGLVGYTSRVPETHELLNALTWDSDLVARDYQPRRTFFERAAEAGVAVSSVALERFEASGLTESALRGARFVSFEHEKHEEVRIALTVQAASEGQRSLVYAYERELDHCGHVEGAASPAWLEHLIRIDTMCERLRDELPDEVRMVITGDHGMVDIPPGNRFVVEDESELLVGMSALAGEGRFRQVYVDHDSPVAVAARWQDRLGESAWVLTRDEAIEAGWFGPVDDRVRERYGHVLVAMRDDYAVMTRQFPRELTLVGMHGSLTPAETMVPLFLD
ncbi:MAG TPA: nucleotide pyrophosphatase/phosphodiesterase family protein [Propionibacteriaceae bacterium]|nr:nucleotide pyrophosphatase/phosphodiesterase family protein [Propionibacteriaceae bacterium]